MKALLNIGLNREGTFPLSPREAVTALYAASFPDEDDLRNRLWTVGRSQVRQSQTEPTLIVEVDVSVSLEAFDECLAILSRELGQDCIAWVTASGNGHLSGPNAEAWGSFNPDYFLDFALA